jgi:hypothetical protein
VVTFSHPNFLSFKVNGQLFSKLYVGGANWVTRKMRIIAAGFDVSVIYIGQTDGGRR